MRRSYHYGGAVFRSFLRKDARRTATAVANPFFANPRVSVGSFSSNEASLDGLLSSAKAAGGGSRVVMAKSALLEITAEADDDGR